MWNVRQCSARARIVLWIVIGISACSTTASGVPLFPVITDINNAMGTTFSGVNIFADPPAFFVDDAAVDQGNQILVYSMNGIPQFGGAGFSVSVSNGENGINSTDLGNNIDVPNIEPVNPAILSVNGGNKLQNGNAIRFSVWLRQDPNNPVTRVPQIEPVLKLELWKEALSGFADFNPGPFPGFGDRVWDTDQNAGDPTYNGFNQSQASWVDMDNNGVTSFGKPVSQSLVTSEWRLVETTLVVDDDPLNDGIGWTIGLDDFTVADIEEIRGVLYFGDFLQTNLTNAGGIWADNVLMEIFPNQAALQATPNPNPRPTAGLSGDFNGDGQYTCADVNALVAGIAGGANPTGFDLTSDGLVNGADLVAWRTAAGSVLNSSGNPVPIGDANLDGVVDGSDFGLWNSSKFTPTPAWCSGDFNADGVVDGSDFGLWNSNKFTSADGLSMVPEPALFGGVAILGIVGLIRRARRR